MRNTTDTLKLNVRPIEYPWVTGSVLALDIRAIYLAYLPDDDRMTAFQAFFKMHTDPFRLELDSSTVTPVTNRPVGRVGRDVLHEPSIGTNS